MGLYQAHWQYKDGHTEMMAQREINSIPEMTKFSIDVMEAYPLPENVIWMMCNEKSKHFVWMAADDSEIKE